MSLKDGKPYQTDELGRISDIVEARELIHELSAMIARMLSIPVGLGPFTMPFESVLLLSNPEVVSVIHLVANGAHSLTCEEFDRQLLMETGQLVPIDPEKHDAGQTRPLRETLPEEIEALLKSLSNKLE